MSCAHIRSTASISDSAPHGYKAADERLRESLCTLGNGYFATRGAL
ncbi:hypothetical protein ACWDRX_29315, partial [Streptomyces nigra]